MRVVVLSAAVLFAAGCLATSAEIPVQPETLTLPAGFTAEVYARVPGARSLAVAPSGTVFVGTRGHAVYAVSPGGAEVVTVADGLDAPAGVAYHRGDLYVAEVSRVLRYEAVEPRLHRPPRPTVVSDAFPDQEDDGWKFIAFGPDGRLYIPVGAPCNACEPDDQRHASIMRMWPDGDGLEVFARGVRSTAGFDWDPATGVLWFTDTGRDWMSHNRPPDELNRAPVPGLHFGFPFCHGDSIPDPAFVGRPCSQFVPPVAGLGADVDALGMRFYTGDMFPARYRGRIFIAEHGSWSRTHGSGYRLVTVDPRAASPRSEPFASGWLEGQAAWGRPVDVAVMPDGALLVSDDSAGALFRITYVGTV